MQRKIKIFLIFSIPLFIVLHFLGWIKFYYTFSGYDKIVHFFAGISIILVSNWFLEEYYPQNGFKKNWLLILFFLFVAAVIWEIFEYLVDHYMGRSYLAPLQLGWFDTLTDFLADFAGAGCILLCLYLKRKRYCLK